MTSRILTLLFLLVTVYACLCSAQTLCVEPVLQPFPDPALQHEVELLFQQKGFKTDCQTYDLAVSFYQLNAGGVVDGVYDVTVQSTGGSGTVIGTVTVSPRTYNAGGWTFTVRERGRVTTIARVHSSSVNGGVKQLVKKIKHSRQ